VTQFGTHLDHLTAHWGKFAAADFICRGKPFDKLWRGILKLWRGILMAVNTGLPQTAAAAVTADASPRAAILRPTLLFSRRAL
jgi:hypothetical protein